MGPLAGGGDCGGQSDPGKIAACRPLRRDITPSSCRAGDVRRLRRRHQPAGADLDFRFQDAKAALDIGERFVAFNDLGRRQADGIGGQQQLAVHQAHVSERTLVDVIGEPLALEVDADDAAQVGIADLMAEAGASAAVGQFAPVALAAGTLRIELAAPFGRPMTSGTMPGKPTVLSQRSTPGLESGSHRRLITITRTSASTSMRWRVPTRS